MLPPGGEAGRDLFTRTAAGSEPPAAAGRRGSEPSAAAGRGIPGREPNRAARPKTSVRRLACHREPLSSRRAERSTLSALAPPSSDQRFRPPAPVERSARVPSPDTRAGSTGAGGREGAQRSTGAGGRNAPRRRSDPPPSGIGDSSKGKGASPPRWTGRGGRRTRRAGRAVPGFAARRRRSGASRTPPRRLAAEIEGRRGLGRARTGRASAVRERRAH